MIIARLNPDVVRTLLCQMFNMIAVVYHKKRTSHVIQSTVSAAVVCSCAAFSVLSAWSLVPYKATIAFCSACPAVPSFLFRPSEKFSFGSMASSYKYKRPGTKGIRTISVTFLCIVLLQFYICFFSLLQFTHSHTFKYVCSSSKLQDR
mgnify:CR=1 FL=1